MSSTVRVEQNVIESVISHQSTKELNLKKIGTITVVVKATAVMISNQQ